MQKDANLAELEKCFQTHIFLQNFVLIQPRTSSPKICKFFANFPNCATQAKAPLRRGCRPVYREKFGPRTGLASSRDDASQAREPRCRTSSYSSNPPRVLVLKCACACERVQSLEHRGHRCSGPGERLLADVSYQINFWRVVAVVSFEITVRFHNCFSPYICIFSLLRLNSEK